MKIINKFGDALLERLAPRTEAAAACITCSQTQNLYRRAWYYCTGPDTSTCGYVPAPGSSCGDC
ncbi:hypothetical protein [Streptosporangium sp. NPDC000239]|uniref:Uncharacterized protein n=1 Tax=Streptosporangium jomthongense TaxID=1193683 RepID=A0ABV8EUJ5_9ACTN